MLQERYINPCTDFGFKKLFNSEPNKDLLISFLNALLSDQPNIIDISYLPIEHFGSYGSRRAIFDVYCQTEAGTKFIVEMQNVYQQFFKDRSIFYTTFPIQEQAKAGEDWNFELKEVYTVGLLNFAFHDGKTPDNCYRTEVKLMDTKTKEVFYDKLTMIYIELPKFTKQEGELETMMDKWLFLLKNMSRLFDRPQALQERIFKKAFEQAEIALFTPDEQRGYQDSVKAYRDINNAIVTAKREGKAEGLLEGKAQGLLEGKAEGILEGERKKAFEIARNLKKAGVDAMVIQSTTGLTMNEIDSL